MKKHIIKNTVAAVLFAASLPVVSAANGAELPLPVHIDQVGKMKFLISAEPKNSLSVVIYDGDNNIIHQEAISTKKLYNFANLADGNYRMEILDSHKNIVQKKAFHILTQTRRDLVAAQ